MYLTMKSLLVSALPALTLCISDAGAGEKVRSASGTEFAPGEFRAATFSMW